MAQLASAGDDLDVAVEDALEQRLAFVGGVHLEADVAAVGGEGLDDERAGSPISARTPATRPSWRRSRPIATRSTPASERTRR